MKKIFTIFLMTFIGISLFAQITLTESTHVPSAGESVNWHYIPNVAVDYGSAGATQTWDLSAYTSPTSAAMNYILPQNAQVPNDFPDATFVATWIGSETYYSSNANFLFLEGQYSPGQAKLTYTDKREMLVFPLTFNTTHNGTFEGEVLNIGAGGQLFSREGTTTITGDGYGTLMLPYVTVTDVLRIKVEATYSDTYQGTPVYFYDEFIYFWYCADMKDYLAAYTEIYISGSLFARNYFYMAESSYTNIKENIAASKDRITTFPNPASDVLYFENAPDSYLLNIYNVSGLLLNSMNLSGNNGIDISHLQQGMYILEFISDNHKHFDRIVVNR
jgi:hypothetical protein